MMLRIDLLRERERRYQGPVSKPFLLRAGVTLLVIAVLLFMGQRVHVALTLSRSIAQSEASLADLGPFHERLLSMQSISSGTEQYVKELSGWSRPRLAWHRLFLELQSKVPPNVQLLRLDMKDEIYVPPLAPPAPGEVPKQPEPVRALQVRISGRAQGDKAEDAVSRLIQDLKPPRGATNAVYRTVTLLSMQRDTRGDVAQSTFEIEIAGPERELK